jgi:hypothetical protein
MMKMEEGWRKNVDFKLSDVGLTYDIRQSLLVKRLKEKAAAPQSEEQCQCLVKIREANKHRHLCSNAPPG